MTLPNREAERLYSEAERLRRQLTCCQGDRDRERERYAEGEHAMMAANDELERRLLEFRCQHGSCETVREIAEELTEALARYVADHKVSRRGPLSGWEGDRVGALLRCAVDLLGVPVDVPADDNSDADADLSSATVRRLRDESSCHTAAADYLDGGDSDDGGE